MSFGVQVFNFDEVQFMDFSFVACTFWCYVYKTFAKFKIMKFAPVFSSKSLVILTFKFVYDTFLVFRYDVREESSFILSHTD